MGYHKYEMMDVDVDADADTMYSTVEFFPDMSQFETPIEQEPIAEPQKPSQWELTKIGTFQSNVEQRLMKRKSKSRALRQKFFNSNQLPVHEIVGLANDIFGFNGWSTSVVDGWMDAEDINEIDKQYSGVYLVQLKVILRDGYSIEAMGKGKSVKLPSKHQCFSKCKKEAVLDGIRNCMMNLHTLVVTNCVKTETNT